VWFSLQPALPIAAGIPLLAVNLWLAFEHSAALLLDVTGVMIFPVGWFLKAFFDFAGR
jgi:hypothetical protein